jgi:phosphoserine phosphatase
MSYVVTLVAARPATTLAEATIARVRDVLLGGAVSVLSPGEAVDIASSAAPDMAAVRAALEDAAIDAFAVPATGRRAQVLVADMDSTIVTTETLDEIAAYAGIKDRIAAITARSMNGELDFREALRERVAMLAGLDLSALEATWQSTKLNPGAQELVRTMRANGATTALVSGGFTFFTSRVAALCGFELHRANTLLDDGKVLTGEVGEPILDRDAKLAELNRLVTLRGLTPAASLAIGDGANDLAMIRAAGLGIAYHARPVVAAEARLQIRHGDLRAALFVQGYRAVEFVIG